MADNNIQNQVKSFYTKLGTPQKALLIGAPIVVVALLVVFLLTGGSKEMAVLYSGLEQSDAGKIVEYLKSNNIQYELKDNGSSILVEKSQVNDARLSLASAGLPESSIVGYELFDKANLGMSEFVQKLNYRRALEGELAKTISALDEVKKARVHIVIPETALFEKDQKEPTASVTLQLNTGRNLSQKGVEGIQTLIASSVEGMNKNNVSILDHKGKLLTTKELDVNSIAGLTAQQYEQQKGIESYLMTKAQSMLDNALGVGNSNVRINAELDFTKIEQTKTDYDPESQVIRSEQSMQEASNVVDSLINGGSSTNRSQTNLIQNYEISQVVEHITNGVGGVKRLSVAAIINNKPKVVDSAGVKTLTYIPRTDEDIQKLTDIIKNAVGYNPDRNDQITVTNVLFDNNLEDLETELTPRLDWYEETDNKRLFILIGVILLTMFLMYRFMQSKFIKEKIRIALELPGRAEDMVDLDTESQQQQLVEDLNLDSFNDNLMLLPSELPSQLLLDSDGSSNVGGGFIDSNLNLDSAGGVYPRKGSIKGRKALTGHNVELDEENLMKIEIRNKVQEYVDTNTIEAVRLVRSLIAQDFDNR